MGKGLITASVKKSGCENDTGDAGIGKNETSNIHSSIRKRTL
jgi:hypothetical protein